MIDPATLKTHIIESLQALKAENIVCLDVRHLTTITDYMLICTGSSSRHTTSLATRVIDDLEKLKIKARHIEGQTEGEWVLIDYNDVIVHIMQQDVRDFYELEKFWSKDVLRKEGIEK
jgi:ribosome-associated protein